MPQRKLSLAQFLDLAARLTVFLPDLDRMARPREADGRRESAQAGSDDEDFFHAYMQM